MRIPDFYKDCSSRSPTGAINAHISSGEDAAWAEYLSEVGIRTEVIDALEARPGLRVGVILDIEVPETSRGAGHGRRLFLGALREFEENAVDAVILLADMQVENAFDLVDWYERHGLQRVDRDALAPCMMKAEQELIGRIRQINGAAAEEPSP